MTDVLSFDFETLPITAEEPVPDPVCMSYGWVGGENGLLVASEGIELLRRQTERDVLFVGAETAFDVFVATKYDSALFEVFTKLAEAGRLTDVLLRQRLLDIAAPKRHRLMRYNLDTVSQRMTGIRVPKDDPWRLRYGELVGLPVSEYPEAAVSYAIGDAEATRRTWEAQEEARKGKDVQGVNYKVNFPNHDILADEYRQQMRSLSLKDMANTGMNADSRSVRKLKEYLTQTSDEILPGLVEKGFVVPQYRRNDNVLAESLRSMGLEVSTTASGRPSLTKKVFEQVEDPLLKLLGTGWKEHVGKLEKTPYVSTGYKVSEKTIKTYVEARYRELGEPVPATEKGGVQIDAAALKGAKDEDLLNLSKYRSYQKLLGNDLKLLERAVAEPFHPHYTTLKQNGRSATGSEGGEGTVGNVQNMPSTPGVRECWTAPEGYVIVQADWSAAELSTFGQICEWWVGWSECGRMIREGICQHSAVAALMLGYEEPTVTGWKRVNKERKTDKVVEKKRQAAKIVGFGRKTLMAAKTLAANFQKKGQDYSVEECHRIIEAHDSVIKEMSAYDRCCESYAREPGAYGTSYDLVHPWSGRCAGELRYTDVRNYPFSGLAQDMGTVALWWTFLACRGLHSAGKDDPLYGSKLWLYVHDEISIISPREKASKAAIRLGEIMEEAAGLLLPDVGCKAEPYITEQLSKAAGPVFNESGELVPWDMYEQCALLAKNRTVEQLAAQGFPVWLARETKEKEAA